jgi:hypothetical protein
MIEALNRNLTNPRRDRPMHGAIATSNVNPHGGPYAVLGTDWWQWVFSLPVHDSHGNVIHPLLTSGAVDCSLGQSGNLWFLAGNLGGSTSRSCTVPRNTALFFPILNSWADNTGITEPTNLTLPQLQALAAFFVENPTSLHASVDAVNIPITAANHGLAPFSYRAPNTDNLLQYFGEDVPGPGWPYGNTPIGVVVAPAASDGYWLEINPLGPGVHTVKFGGTSGTFTVDITYTITVN